MPQAVGILRFGPSASTVPRKGRWLVLACDPDWFAMFAPQVHREMPGRWVNVVDHDRVAHGEHGAPDPRLALVKPEFQEPAWGPHVSIIRGNCERPSLHLDLWDLGVELGDVRMEMFSMVESRKHYEAKAAILEHDLANMRPGVRPKFRRRHEEDLASMRETIHDRITRLGRLEHRERQLGKAWKRMQAKQSLPDEVMPGGKIQFGYEPELRRARTHWYLEVSCNTLSRLRVFFGLPPRPKVPYHLTVAVTSGH